MPSATTSQLFDIRFHPACVRLSLGQRPIPHGKLPGYQEGGRWASAISHTRDHFMTQLRWDVAAASALGRSDLIKLIRKLRWIGLEEEARQLQHTARSFHTGLFACESD